MSKQNVEIVREVMGLLSEAESGRLTPALFERFATDVRIDMSRRVFDPNVYEGHTGMRRLAAEERDAWAEFRIEEAERFVDAGDRVIVIETRGGRGSGSGVEVDLRLAVIWTLRKGKVVRIETYIDAQEALESAGIDEQEM
jgi:ketosteroid isomerase-like protein